jgi:PPOX class probable F420-dependent enzyme
MLDMTTEFGSRVARRLRDEPIIWLVTVGATTMPQASPVWFVWEDTMFRIYSQPDKPKLRNIAANPKVALHFDSDGQGGNIVVFTGEAYIDAHAPPAHEVAAYVAKYAERIAGLGLTPLQFAQGFSVAIHVTPTQARGH